MVKKVLITGSTGFIGSYFIKNIKGYCIEEADLLVRKVGAINFTGADTVLHLAALVHQMKDAPEGEYFKINRDLAFETAARARGQGVNQFILMSTAKVYGESTTGLPAWDEDSECNPADPYGKSKLEAEKAINSLANENFKVAIIRSPLVYGAGVKANMLNLVRMVKQFPVLPFKEIDNRRSIVYIGNLAALICKIIDTEVSGVFIAGDRSPVSTTQLIQLIAKGLNKRLWIVKTPAALNNIIRRFKPSVAERLWGSLELNNKLTNEKLGFKPPFTTEEGIREMSEWFLKMK